MIGREVVGLGVAHAEIIHSLRTAPGVGEMRVPPEVGALSFVTDTLWAILRTACFGST
ncbi:MAG: hypothetical protein GY930_05640 [bacterium]|nr:hypothetical protein [bacterium]